MTKRQLSSVNVMVKKSLFEISQPFNRYYNLNCLVCVELEALFYLVILEVKNRIKY